MAKSNNSNLVNHTEKGDFYPYSSDKPHLIGEKQNLVKHSGQVFTPAFLVKNILDICHYTGTDILQKHIIDNSCGDGAFLCEIVERYCSAYIQTGSDICMLKSHLEQYIHGIELEQEAYENCLYNLNLVTRKYQINNVQWDVLHQDALSVMCFDGAMDFVVGNPPYVRVHNLNTQYQNVKRFYFANAGMTDIYLVFFEIGFRMLNSTGRLCYITPSSWLNSVAATNMRAYILAKKTLCTLVDLGHYQPFVGATTYTLISYFDKAHTNEIVNYYLYDEQEHKPKQWQQVHLEDISIEGKFYLAAKQELQMLKQIRSITIRKWCVVKNGFATLADNVFIGDLPFSEYTIPILKASTGKWSRAFFPYDKNGKPLSRDILFRNVVIKTYMETRKATLLKGKAESTNPEWYLYGRTQALKDVYAYKIAINTIIKDMDSIRLEPVPDGSGVYSGLYMLTNVPFSILESLIKSDCFIRYIHTLKCYKSGGYYTFNSKDLEKYINFQIENYANTANFIPIDQSGVSKCSLTLF